MAQTGLVISIRLTEAADLFASPYPPSDTHPRSQPRHATAARAARHAIFPGIPLSSCHATTGCEPPSPLNAHTSTLAHHPTPTPAACRPSQHPRAIVHTSPCQDRVRVCAGEIARVDAWRGVGLWFRVMVYGLGFRFQGLGFGRGLTGTKAISATVGAKVVDEAERELKELSRYLTSSPATPATCRRCSRSLCTCQVNPDNYVI